VRARESSRTACRGAFEDQLSHHLASARRPASVIRPRMTSVVCPAITKCSVRPVASPSRMRSTKLPLGASGRSHRRACPSSSCSTGIVPGHGRRATTATRAGKHRDHRGHRAHGPYVPYALLVRTNEYVAAPHFPAWRVRTKPTARVPASWTRRDAMNCRPRPCGSSKARTGSAMAEAFALLGWLPDAWRITDRPDTNGLAKWQGGYEASSRPESYHRLTQSAHSSSSPSSDTGGGRLRSRCD
jgi:hypothetical protein